MASSTSHKGHEPVALTPVPASSQQSPSDPDTRLAQALAAVPQLADEPELSHASVGLTDKLLGAGQYGQTMLGEVNNERYAVKLYENRQPEAVYAYFNEKACLQALGSCSSDIKLKMAGCLQDSLYPMHSDNVFWRTSPVLVSCPILPSQENSHYPSPTWGCLWAHLPIKLV
ncbi:hypothetical protein WJX77_002044 [Trebouxia sp. C0004]